MSGESTTDPPEPFENLPAGSARAILRPKVPALVVTRSEAGDTNVMTAMYWMSAGYGDQFLVAVGQDEYTHELITDTGEFVVAAPTSEMVEAVALCGAVSGRDADKVDALDLDLLPGASVDVPLLAAAAGNFECVVADTYDFGGYTFVFSEIQRAYVRSGWFADGTYGTEYDTLLYLGSRDVDGRRQRVFTEHGEQWSASDEDALDRLED